LQKPLQAFLGEQDGRIFVNSAQGNRSVTAVYQQLMQHVAPDGAVPKNHLMALVKDVTGESPPMDQTIFGAMALRAYLRHQLFVFTGRRYTDPGLRKMTRDWDFLERTGGLDWSCVGSLDCTIGRHLTDARAQWQRNLAMANEARRPVTDQSSGP
jgi:hypothetical protein